MVFRRFRKRPWRRPARPKRRIPFRRRKKRVVPTRPAVHRFTRVVQDGPYPVILSTPLATPGWIYEPTTVASIYRQWQFKLDDLPSFLEFQNLFVAYRIKGVRMQIYWSNTQTHANAQVMITYTNNWQGVSTILTEDYFNQRQATKRRLVLNNSSRPALDIYMPVRQLTNVWSGSVVSNDYGTVKPRWISTQEPSTPHYGVNMRLERVDGENTSTDTELYPHMRVVLKYYFECRGVS